MNKTLKLTALLLATSLMQPAFATTLAQAISSSDRAAQDVARDEKRKPDEVIKLLDIKPGDQVIDLMSGTGYYTDILSRYVGDNGKVVAHNSPYVVNRFAKAFLGKDAVWQKKLQSSQWQKNVTPMIAELDNMQYPVPLDGALMVLFYHDTIWQGIDRKTMNRHLYNALKPGASFVIVDHSAKAGTQANDVKTLHRIDKQFVIDEVSQAGFVLDTDSNILANPKDSRDYNIFRDSRTNRDSTDRFVLKFVKPVE